jgi:signal transduction histidine kinase/CheY-like chemotaxis protein
VCDYASYSARWTASGEPIQPEEWASARAIQRGETVVNQELQIWRFDGTQAYVLNSAAPIRDAEGRVAGCAVAIRDITEHKQAEERHRELELRVQRAQKEESLGTLAGGIAHDFNNLLTVILGNLDLVSWRLSEGAVERRLLGQAADAARDAADLCQQLLAYVGKAQLSFRPVHINRLLEDMARLMAAALSRRGQLRWNLAAEVPLVNADVSRVRQIIMSLIVNASEALGDEPGQITLSTGSARLTEKDLQSPWVQGPLPPGEYVFLAVADTGCGIDPDLVGRLFEPFFSTKFTGRGLGLAAVLGIVRAHHGVIQVESAPGRGSRFRVWLPALGPASAAVDPVAVAARDWRGSGTILVVDDEEAVRTTATRMLELLGFEVVSAADGPEAIELFRADPQRFRAVILDVTMPKLDGIATFRELVRMREDVRAILSSGYARDEIMTPLQSLGLFGFLQKPYTLHDLVAAIQDLPESAEMD